MASLWISLVALVVSLVALYLSSLKRAEIWVTQLPGIKGGVSDRERRNGAAIVEARVHVAMFNVGARAGVLLSIKVTPTTTPLFNVHGSWVQPTFMRSELRSAAVPAGRSQRRAEARRVI